MNNILIEMAAEIGLPITSEPRVLFFDELATLLRTSDSVSLRSVMSLKTMDPRDVLGVKNQLIRMSKRGIVSIDSALLMEDTFEVKQIMTGIVKLTSLTSAEKEGVTEVDFVIAMTPFTKKKLIEQSGSSSDFIVHDTYMAQPDKASIQPDRPQSLPGDKQEEDVPAARAQAGLSVAAKEFEPTPSMASLGGEVPRAEIIPVLETQIDPREREEAVVSKPRAPEMMATKMEAKNGRPPESTVTIKESHRGANIFKAQSSTRSKKLIAYAVGFIATGMAAFVMIHKTTRIEEQYTAIERQIKEPAEGLRVVKLSELEDLYASIAKLKADQVSLEREFEIRLGKEQAKITEDLALKRASIEKDSYEKGRADAVGLTVSVQERIANIAKRFVVITGGCEAIGRGNRIDRIGFDHYGANVKYWLVDPANLSLAGVVASNAKLMEMSDGPVTEVRCFGGEASLVPSLDAPQIEADGKSHIPAKSSAVQP